MISSVFGFYSSDSTDAIRASDLTTLCSILLYKYAYLWHQERQNGEVQKALLEYLVLKPVSDVTAAGPLLIYSL